MSLFGLLIGSALCITLRMRVCGAVILLLLVAVILAPSPLGASDGDDPLTIALTAMKMTPRDLSFKKDHVDSAWIDPSIRHFLHQPGALPAAGQKVLARFTMANDLAGVLNALPTHNRTSNIQHSTSNVERTDLLLLRRSMFDVRCSMFGQLPDLHPALAEAVQQILAAAEQALPLLREAIPPTTHAAFPATAINILGLDGKSTEPVAWDQLGIDTLVLRAMIRRGDALELDDDEIANAILDPAGKFQPDQLARATALLAAGVDAAVDILGAHPEIDQDAITFDTGLGKVVIAGDQSDRHHQPAFLIIDLGGDDQYEHTAAGANGLAGRPLAIVIDCAGHDQYRTDHGFAQGAGLFGIGVLVDLAGDDRYEAGHLSQGAGLFGSGLLVDQGGADTFTASIHAQGAATFGIGILSTADGDTTYRADSLAQGFGGMAGCGLLLDRAGADRYTAAGSDLCGWLPGHRFTLSQGFGFGMRPFAGGGWGILVDMAGDDCYVADVYGQGASYWYAVGLLLDAGGNDLYKAYQYCQGAGIHLASGLLHDGGGDDRYDAHAICQGSAHDYSVGTLIDQAGIDAYKGDTTAQGSAIYNSFAMLLDQQGDDTYSGTVTNQSIAAGHNGGRREYGSIAVLLDLGGSDRYAHGQVNDAVTLKPMHGVLVDEETETCGPRRVRGRETCAQLRSPSVGQSPPHPVNPHHPIERLLRVSLSDRPDAGDAWTELKQTGLPALEYLLTRLDSPSVSVRARTEELIDHLGPASVPVLIAGLEQARNDEIARRCAYFLARFEEATEAIPLVMTLLATEENQATALYTLGHLRAWSAFGPAMTALRSDRETVRLRAAQALGRIGDARATPALVDALGDEFWSVRYAAQEALVLLGRSSIGPLRDRFARARPLTQRHIAAALAALGYHRAPVLTEIAWRQADPRVRAAVLGEP
jgi:HEAT repeat protein